jgi:signal transduction histidine kinase
MVGMMRVLRSGPALLLAPENYLRVVFVLVGAALALALGIVDFTVLALVAGSGTPAWLAALIGVVLVGGPLTAGMIPAARQVEGAAAQSLLVVQFREGPPGPAISWAQRGRTLGWFLLHVFTGAVVVAALVGLVALSGRWWTIPAAAATLLSIVLAGRLLARLAPALLGPSYAERLERMQADATRATERTRIAREIHDSIGHALSLATVQASAARKLIGRDPAFVEAALEAIETTTRRAVADLDHVLGLLRDDTQLPAETTPAPDLGSLDELLTAARSAGLTVVSTVSGELSLLPLLVSREAYRIVQEGLTNALKYSTDATATLSLSLGAGTLGIHLTNPVSQRRAARAGRGLHGINERATTLGGTTTAGADGGRWTLSVAIPAWEV